MIDFQTLVLDKMVLTSNAAKEQSLCRIWLLAIHVRIQLQIQTTAGVLA